MAFRMRQDAEKWFSEIQPREAIGTKFDLYYFCMIVGLVVGRRSDPTAGGRTAPEFVQSFVEDHRACHRLVIGLLVTAELHRLGIGVSEKEDVRKTLCSIVDPLSSTGLSDEGIRLLNSYASGGYDHLAEKRQSKPYHLDEFLADFVELIEGEIASRTPWAD